MLSVFAAVLLTAAEAVENYPSRRSYSSFEYGGYVPNYLNRNYDYLFGFDYYNLNDAYIAREYDDFDPIQYTEGPIYISPHRDVFTSSDSELGFSSGSDDSSSDTSRSGDSASSSGSDTGTHETSNPASHDSTTSSDTENPSSSDSNSESIHSDNGPYAGPDNGHGDVSSGDSGSGYNIGYYGHGPHDASESTDAEYEGFSSSDYYEEVSSESA